MDKLSEVNGYGLAAAKPAGATEGYLYYETDTSLLKRYNGSSWDTMSTVITPTGAPARPWWQNNGGIYCAIDAQQHGTAWLSIGGRTAPLSLSGTLDNELGTQGVNSILAGGSTMYDASPVLNTLMGARGGCGAYSPFKTHDESKLVDWYCGTLIGTHGLGDHDFMFGMTEIQPTLALTAGQWFTWASHYPAHIGFHGVYGTTNWQIFGTHNTGSAWSTTAKDSGVALTAQTVYLLEMAFDSATTTVSFYINGSLVGTIDMTTESGPYNAAHNDPTAEKMDVYLGMMPSSATPSSTLDMDAAWMRVITREAALEPFNGSW